MNISLLGPFVSCGVHGNPLAINIGKGLLMKGFVRWVLFLLCRRADPRAGPGLILSRE